VRSAHRLVIRLALAGKESKQMRRPRATTFRLAAGAKAIIRVEPAWTG